MHLPEEILKRTVALLKKYEKVLQVLYDRPDCNGVPNDMLDELHLVLAHLQFPTVISTKYSHVHYGECGYCLHEEKGITSKECMECNDVGLERGNWQPKGEK